MRGINKVWVAGNVSGSIIFSETDSGDQTCSFQLASDRVAKESTLTTWVKVNAYLPGLVEACRAYLVKGGYVSVIGELMNRDGPNGKLTEVRARELVFR